MARIKVASTIALLTLLALSWCETALCQDYPNKPITIVVAAPIGSPQDILVRTLGVATGRALGAGIAVDNRPGGRGVLAYATVGRSAPDGYTLLFASNGFVISKVVDPALAYEPLKQYTPVAVLATADMAFFVSKGTPVRSVREFVSYAKSNPGKLAYASPGTGTPQNLAMELFKLESGIDLLHVGYKDHFAAVMAITSGQVNAVISPYFGPLLQYARAGEVKLLAMLTNERVNSIPEVPTLRESGYPSVNLQVWYGLFGPAGLPNNVVMRLNEKINATMLDSSTRNAFEKQGLNLLGGPPEKLKDRINADSAKWARVVKQAGIKPD